MITFLIKTLVFHKSFICYNPSYTLCYFYEVLEILFQMDNQLFGARKPVLMYMSNEHADRAAGPALHIFVHKTSSCNWNAEIYKVCSAVLNISTFRTASFVS